MTKIDASSSYHNAGRDYASEVWAEHDTASFAPASGARAGYVPAYVKGLAPIDGHDLLNRQFPARSTILAPWLPTRGLAMIHAPRGVGKTHLALNIAYAIASGSSFLGWEADQVRRVVYIDGEMSIALLQARFKAIDAQAKLKLENPENFKLVASDYEPDGLPDLSNPESQKYYDKVLENAEVIVLDNLSTLVRGGRENEADSWGPVQDWLLNQRRAGRAVVIIHHSGKNGLQRGSSRREDVLDTVIGLKRPPDYQATQGARFEVYFEKARGFFGPDAEPFEARLTEGGEWITQPLLAGDDDEQFKLLVESGLSVREVAERTGLSKSTVGRKRKGLGDA